MFFYGSLIYFSDRNQQTKIQNFFKADFNEIDHQKQQGGIVNEKLRQVIGQTKTKRGIILMTRELRNQKRLKKTN